MQIVSVDFIAETLNLDRYKLIKWINSEQVLWNNQDYHIERIKKWTKDFLASNSQLIRSHMLSKKNMKISRECFVKPKSSEEYEDVTVFEAILPKSLNARLQTLTNMELLFVQNVVIDNLSNNKSDYTTMADECGIPLGLLQEIVFGITTVMPHFIIDRIINWSKGVHLNDSELSIKEEQLFHVKID